MLEASLYAPLIAGALQENWPLYRIADGSPGKKPFDIGGCDPLGRAVGLEVKVIQCRLISGATIPWQQFELHQRAWLRAFTVARADALAALYCEQTKDLTVYYFANQRELDFSHENLTQQRLIKQDGRYLGWNFLLEQVERRKALG